MRHGSRIPKQERKRQLARFGQAPADSQAGKTRDLRPKEASYEPPLCPLNPSLSWLPALAFFAAILLDTVMEILEVLLSDLRTGVEGGDSRLRLLAIIRVAALKTAIGSW